MKSIKHIVLIMILTMSLLSCQNTDLSTGVTIDYIPIQFEKGGNWSFIDKDGNVILKDRFGHTNIPSPIINDVFWLKKTDGLTVYHLEGDSFREIEELSGLTSVGYMSDGLLPICRKGEGISVVNINGDKIFELSLFDGIEVKQCWSYSDGFMRVMLADGSFVFVDKNGNRAFGQRFRHATNFQNGVAAVQRFLGDETDLDDETDNGCLIDTKGSVLYELKRSGAEYDNTLFDFEKRIFSFEGETSEGDKWHRIDDFEGKSLCSCPEQIDDVKILSKEYYIFEDKDGFWGVMGYNGEQMIDNKYEEIIPIGRYFLAKQHNQTDRVILIDEADNYIKELRNEYMFSPEQYGYKFATLIYSDEQMYILDNKACPVNEQPFVPIYTDPYWIGFWGQVWNENVVSYNSLLNKASASIGIRDANNYHQEDNIDVKAILNCYPNSKVKALTKGKKYYRAIYQGERTEVHLMRVEGGKIKADKIFPVEYSDIAAIVEYNKGLLVGINWSEQCKIVTLSENMEAISSRIYNYSDGEWTQLDSLSLLPSGSYYAELKTNCGDCGEGIRKYKITAQLNHKIISSTSEAIEEYKIE